MSATNPTPKKSAGKAPSHHAYHVREYGEGSEKKSFWTRIGGVWAHRDGEGFNLKLECVPVDGDIVIRTAKEERGQ